MKYFFFLLKSFYTLLLFVNIDIVLVVLGIIYKQSAPPHMKEHCPKSEQKKKR